MIPVRLQKRLCTDKEKIERCLAETETGFLGLSDGETPYVVPLNFVWRGGAIYFHGAAEGRKIDMLRRNPRACFTVCESYGTIADPIPAHTDTAYLSVILEGTLTLVGDLAEARDAMQDLLDKYVPGYYDRPLAASHLEKYVSSMGSHTAVYKLSPDGLAAKENPANPAAMFYAGRTRQSDQPGQAAGPESC